MKKLILRYSALIWVPCTIVCICNDGIVGVIAWAVGFVAYCAFMGALISRNHRPGKHVRKWRYKRVV